MSCQILAKSVQNSREGRHFPLLSGPAKLLVQALFPAIYTPVSVPSCPSKTSSPLTRIEQLYSRRSTTPETHTGKRALNSPFSDSTSDTVIQLRRVEGV
ncbi:hypothetical protein TNCV_4179161 [Trichonephila clavipes]|nr:hypothetical protein TNCV_4179161 [Trichonephila clavipes]